MKMLQTGEFHDDLDIVTEVHTTSGNSVSAIHYIVMENNFCHNSSKGENLCTPLGLTNHFRVNWNCTKEVH